MTPLIEITVQRVYINNKPVITLGNLPKKPKIASFWRDLHSHLKAIRSTGGIYLNTQKAQESVFLRGRQISAWFPHKKYSPEDRYRAPRKSGLFTIVGSFQVGPTSVWEVLSTSVLTWPPRQVAALGFPVQF